MSFQKFKQPTNGNTKTFWGRSHLDGAPFRGRVPPLLSNEEYEQHVQPVWDTKYGTFDTSVPDQKLPEGHPNARTLMEVLDGAQNGPWFKVLSYETRWTENPGSVPRMFVFIIWSEQYMELDDKFLQGGLPGANPQNAPTSGFL